MRRLGITERKAFRKVLQKLRRVIRWVQTENRKSKRNWEDGLARRKTLVAF